MLRPVAAGNGGRYNPEHLVAVRDGAGHEAAWPFSGMPMER